MTKRPRRKPRYRWFESHSAWLLVHAPYGAKDFPMWLFPPGSGW